MSNTADGKRKETVAFIEISEVLEKGGSLEQFFIGRMPMPGDVIDMVVTEIDEGSPRKISCKLKVREQ